MAEVEYCHEIDEFENKPLMDEIFIFDSKSMNVNEVHKLHAIGTCNCFIPLNEEEMNIFARHGIDGDSLRKIGDNEYVNTYFGIKYTLSQNGKLTKYFKY